ncbi:MAG: O-antigen ligase family protein, partial [Anaerolineales bacterium]
MKEDGFGATPDLPQSHVIPAETKERNGSPVLFKTIEIVVAFFTFVLVNVNSFVLFRQFPEVDNYYDHEGDYILLAVLTVALIFFLLWRNQFLGIYFEAWKQNKFLVLFLVYASLTIFWTIYFPATFYKLIFLFFSTIAGSYIAVRYGFRGVLDLLSWVGAIFSILSILVVINYPVVGMMYTEYFLGSWVGIFWHRNHAGNIFAFFSMVFLFRLLLDKQLARNHKVLMALFYMLSAMMVFGSRSATGIIVFLFLHFALWLTALWLRFHERMKAWHYYASTAILLAGFLTFITNTAFFFGLLGRSATMTGRVPLWQDLFNNFYLQEPFFGYGYGAFWMLKIHRKVLQISQGWGTQVYFADNGFFDLLINTGAVGLLLFLCVYIPLGIRSFRQGIRSRSWIYFFPFLTFLYIFIGNLTYSFLLEVDQFVWMLLVIMVF